MLRRFLIAGFVVLLAHMQFVPLAFGDSPNAKDAAKIRTKAERLGVGANVQVTLRGRSELRGKLLQIEEKDLVVEDSSGTKFSATFSEIKSIRKAGMSRGAKIAAGAAIGATALFFVTWASWND